MTVVRSRGERSDAPQPFAGAESLRVRGERMRFVWTLLFLPVTLTLLGIVLQNTLSLHSLVLLLIGAMLYVALSRGRFLGGAVRIREGQFGEVFSIVQECARMVGIATPHVYLREDPFVPIVAIGTGEPFALVISAQYIEHFSPGELRFLVGRELAHIACGHTRVTSLLSANGRENAIVSLAFGAWLRTIEYTADRVGLLCCGTLQEAFSAIAVSTFQHVGRRIDLHTFAEQRREIDLEPSLRLGEWLGSTPYATNRIAALAAFAKAPLYERWSERFAERRVAAHDVVARAMSSPGFWRRGAAFVVDVYIVAALVPAASRGGSDAHADTVTGAAAAAVKAHAVVSPALKSAIAKDEDVPRWVGPMFEHVTSGDWLARLNIEQALTWIVFALYVVVLVAYAGQTLGMMICDLRVIGTSRERIGIRRTLLRYACLAISIPMFVGIFAAFKRVQPFERWSQTRLVSGSTGGRS